MSKFQAGDKVKVVSCERKSYWYSDLVGKEFILLGVDKSFGPYIQENEHFGRSFFSECDIEIVQEKEQMKSEAFNLKTNPWFIRVNGQLEFKLIQEWLKSVNFNDVSCNYHSGIKLLTNIDAAGNIERYAMWGDNVKTKSKQAQEIKVTFKVVIDSVTFPEIKSERDLKIEELEQSIKEAQEHLNTLKVLK